MYMLSPDGLSVHKKTADGSMGEMVGSPHATKAEAEAHMKALMANVEDAKPKESITAAPQTAVFIERLDLSEAVLDTEARTVRQTIIRAGLSQNKRLYSEDVLQRSAPLFEGTQTYANHPTPAEIKSGAGRDVQRLTGWIDNVVYENGKLVGTRHFTPNQAGRDAWAIVESIINHHAPASLMGASINALGKARKERSDQYGDHLVIEGIDRVLSVDDVDTPAAGGGFERLIAGGTYFQDVFAVLDYNEFMEARPDYVERLKNSLKLARQDEAVKTANAETEKAKAEAVRIAEELERTKLALKSVVQERESALRQAETARRDLAIEQALREVKLSKAWEKELREELQRAHIDTWAETIERKITLAKSSAAPRVPVTGAGQSVQKPLPAKELSLAPQPGENAESWYARIRQQTSA